jgi:hypothetical protein
MIDFLISLFIKPDVEEALPYREEAPKGLPCSDKYNEVMQHQHEMRKQLYKELKLK